MMGIVINGADWVPQGVGLFSADISRNFPKNACAYVFLSINEREKASHCVFCDFVSMSVDDFG
jgi:hypothetical protein